MSDGQVIPSRARADGAVRWEARMSSAVLTISMFRCSFATHAGAESCTIALRTGAATDGAFGLHVQITPQQKSPPGLFPDRILHCSS
jgi:hypothetical protein